MSDCLPTQDVYGGAIQAHDCLPHTGMDLAPFLGVGLVLIVAGTALYRKLGQRA